MKNEQKDLIDKYLYYTKKANELDFRSRSRRRQNYEIKYDISDEYTNRFIKPFLIRATPRDYSEWLQGWLARGGETTHHYDYGLPSSYYVAIANFTMIPLCGSSAIHVIVPEDVEVDQSYGTGHSKFFFMNNFNCESDSIATYNNVKVSYRYFPRGYFPKIDITVSVECEDSKKKKLIDIFKGR